MSKGVQGSGHLGRQMVFASVHLCGHWPWSSTAWRIIARNSSKQCGSFLKSKVLKPSDPLLLATFVALRAFQRSSPVIGGHFQETQTLHLLLLQHRERKNASLSGKGLYPQVHQRMHDGKVTRPRMKNAKKLHGCQHATTNALSGDRMPSFTKRKCTHADLYIVSYNILKYIVLI